MGKHLKFHSFFLIAAFINLVFFGDCKADNDRVSTIVSIAYFDDANAIYDLSYLVETFFENVLNKDIPLPMDNEYHVNKFEFKGKRISRHLPKIEDLNKQIEFNRSQLASIQSIAPIKAFNYPPFVISSPLQTGEFCGIYRFFLF